MSVMEFVFLLNKVVHSNSSYTGHTVSVNHWQHVLTPPSPSLFPAERDIKIIRPLYSIEVTETETAKFETEISEDDVHGNWKLKGEALHQSPVSQPKTTT